MDDLFIYSFIHILFRNVKKTSCVLKVFGSLYLKEKKNFFS